MTDSASSLHRKRPAPPRPGLPESELDAMAEFLNRYMGLSINRGELGRAVSEAMSEASIEDLGHYLTLVQGRGEPLERLVDRVTVRETYFFRLRQQFDFIREQIIPACMSGSLPGHVLRTWSAGCASGEEVFSLAILFEEAGLSRYHVLGTDISPEALSSARQGRFPRWSMRGNPPAMVERFFRDTGAGYTIAPELSRNVAFRRLNLVEDTYPSAENGTYGLDLILCRNVLIYLDGRTAEKIMDRLYEALAPGGWLITAPVDPAPTTGRWESVRGEYAALYRKPLARHKAIRRAAERSHSRAIGTVSAKPAEIPRSTRAKNAFDEKEYAKAIALCLGLEREATTAILKIKAIANLHGAAEAELAAQEMLAIHPYVPELRFLEAIMLLALNQNERATVVLRQALFIDPELAVVHFTLGSALAAEGYKAPAQRAYERAIKLLKRMSPNEIVPLSDSTALSLLESAEHALEHLKHRVAP